jgi:L-galactose dehydrogenase
LRYQPLGSTELKVSTIGFGASPLGDVFGQVSVEECCDTVLNAVDCGINFFDVSPYYGLTLAEERLGAALHSIRKDVIVATKCGRYGVDHFDYSPRTITLEFEQSLRRLRTDCVDLLQVHDIEFGDLHQIIHETLPAICQLQQQGKTRYVGISSYWPGLLARVAQQVPVDTVLSYCHWNLMMDDMDRELTPVASANNIGLINASPLHMGLFGGTVVPPWHPAPENVKQAASDVVELCRAFSVESSTVALHACLQHPIVATTLIGMRTRAQVQANCAALDFDPPAELVAAIRHRVAPLFNTSWPSGLPENQHNPLHLGDKSA